MIVTSYPTRIYPETRRMKYLFAWLLLFLFFPVHGQETFPIPKLKKVPCTIQDIHYTRVAFNFNPTTATISIDGTVLHTLTNYRVIKGKGGITTLYTRTQTLEYGLNFYTYRDATTCMTYHLAAP